MAEKSGLSNKQLLKLLAISEGQKERLKKENAALKKTVEEQKEYIRNELVKD